MKIVGTKTIAEIRSGDFDRAVIDAVQAVQAAGKAVLRIDTHFAVDGQEGNYYFVAMLIVGEEDGS